MSQSLAKNIIHLVFSTKCRAQLLPFDRFDLLHRFTRGILEDQKCHLIEVNNVTDHVHVLFDLHRTKALSDVVMHVKKGSSRWLKEHDPRFKGFDWQEGYGAFSLGVSQLDAATQYIREQQTRHAKMSFEEEFRGLLHTYGVEFDEQYVWG